MIGVRVRRFAVVIGAAATVGFAATPAAACGGLVGENGTIQLVRTTTLAAYHDGIERYVTSFEFTGEGQEVGSIVPLPDIPTEVVRGGDWTLQRLVREVAPPPTFSEFDKSVSADVASAQVILETQIDALDITILKGGGDEVGRWALDNGFFLTPDAPEVLDFYAERSPIFMAARFDASRAEALGQRAGDGTPIMLTIPTERPWVPLRILGLGVDGDQQIEADVFVLTDDEPRLLAGGAGLELGRSEPASQLLLDDLRSDKGMEWVPTSMWLTHLPLEVAAGSLDFDLAISTSDALPDVSDTGIQAPHVREIELPSPGRAVWPIVAGTIVAIVVLVAVSRVSNRTAPSSMTGAAT
jgi:hypothetical protein